MSEKITSFEEGFNKIIARYNENEKVRKPLKNYDMPIQITIVENDHKFMILVNKDQGIEIKDNTGDETAPIKIEFTDEKTFLDLLNGDVGPVKAYSSGAIKVAEGEIRPMLKLRKLLF